MKTYSVLFALGLLFIFSACQKEDPNAAMEKANKETMQKIFDALNGNTPDALDNLIVTDFIEHTPDPMVEGTGRDALKKAFAMYHQAYPDLKITVNWMVAEGDMVVAHYTWSGTNTGAMGPMPATGKAVNVDGVDIARFKDGKGVEHWGYFDMQKMMEQLGMMPAMGEMPPGEVPPQQ